MPAPMTYTRAQLAAWKRLPGDGAWFCPRSTKDVPGITSLRLRLRHMEMIRAEPTRRGSRYCLTPAGIAERKRLVRKGLIE
jgi:hypothetical protein